VIVRLFTPSMKERRLPCSAIIVAVPREAELLRQISLPGVKRAHMTRGGGGALHAVLSVDKPYEGFGKYVGLAVLGTTGPVAASSKSSSSMLTSIPAIQFKSNGP